MQSRLRIILFISFLLTHLIFFKIDAQTCSLGLPPTTVTVRCGAGCLPLNFIVPDIRETSNYLALDLPYNPYLFESRTDPAVSFASPPQWPGNSYSDKYTLPFPFCFFDSVYNYLVIGSNGCVSFDSSMALKGCDPRLINTLNGRTIPLPSGLYYARALIAGVMQDLDPFDTTRAVTGEKVEYRVEGTAPCRKIVISYNKIPLWPGPLGCQSSINTYQIVLHENTGIIDIYEKDKPPCTGSNFGNAIIGIQNWARDYAVAPRQRNDFVWGGTNINEAFRFLPSGGSSRFVQAQITDGVHIIASTTTATPTLTPGELDVQFSSVCPPATANFMILKTIYSSCTGTGTIEFYDTIRLNHNTTLNATAQTIPPACGGSNGSIIVHVPGGDATPPLQYSINGGPLQADSVFTGLADNTYTIFVQDNGGCSKTFSVNLVGSNVLFASIAVDTPSCNAATDGRIIVTVLNGNPLFQYSINGNPPQASNVFTGLAPSVYIIEVFDSRGCASVRQNITVPQGPLLAVTIQTTTTSCSGASNGTITVNPGNGRPPYQYSINGGPFQASNIFSNLAVGNYALHVTDASGCDVNNVPAQIQAGQPLAPAVTKTDIFCNGGNNGTITVTVGNGSAPYRYSLDGVNYQPGNVFNGLIAGNYTVYVSDNNSCSGTINNITITQPAVLALAASKQDVQCNGEANGTISVNASGGTVPYQYSLNGTNYQAGNNFSGLTAGNYTVYVKDSKACIATQIITVAQPQPLQVNSSTQNASCGGGNDGKITVTANGGNNNYQYSLNGTNFQPSNIFNVAPGTYAIIVKDQNGCNATQSNIIVGLNNTLAIKAISDTNICLSRSVNLNAVSNATQYNWFPGTGLSSTTVANPVATPVSSTTYIVNAVLGPCTGSDSVVVTVMPAPAANAGTDGKICLNDSVQLNASGGVSYQWSPASGLSNASIPGPFAKPRQTTSYNLLVTDANGCTSLTTDAIVVTVIQPVPVNITPNTYVSPGDVIRLHAEGGVSYTWSPATGLNNPAIADPLATITQDITYKVVVTTIDGCKVQDSVTIKGYKGPDIYVPTGFTPNHDGKNDKFVPIPVGIKDLGYFKIYNRWGQLVYSTNKLHEGWDGRFGGIEQDSGVYVWIVRAVTNDDRVIFKRGTVALIR